MMLWKSLKPEAIVEALEFLCQHQDEVDRKNPAAKSGNEQQTTAKPLKPTSVPNQNAPAT